MAGTKVSSHVISDNIALGGSPTTTTQSASDNSTKLATTAYVTTAIANLSDSAPSTLNTLNELAAALGDDANFSTTVTNSIATKLPLAGGTMSGALNMGSQNITNGGDISGGIFTAESASDYPLRVKSTDAFSGIVLQDNSSTTNGNVISVTGDTMNFFTGGTSSSNDIALTLASNNNATFTANVSANRLTLTDGITDTGQAGSATVFNESGSTADFRIESDSNAHMFFLDAGQNSIGIGHANPSSSYSLDVSGQIRTFGNNPALNLREDDSSNQHWQLGSFGGVFAVRNVTGSSYPLQINGSKVGIGTGGPSTLLEVRNDTASSSYGTYPALTIRNDNAAGYGAIHFNEGSTQRARIEEGHGSGTPYLGLYTTGAASGITIKAGNVGINTSSPNQWASYTDSAASVLQVQDTSQRARMVINGGNGAHLDLVDYGGTTNDKHMNIQVDAGQLKFGSLTDAGNAFVQSNIMVMNLDNGYIGIGTATPQKVLQVNTPQSSYVSVGVNGISVNNYAGIHFGYAEANNTDYRKSAIVFERTDLASNDAQGKVHILNGPQNSSGSATLSDAKLTIGESGNVGLGDTSPAHKLEVADSNNYQGVHIRGSNAPNVTFARGTSATPEWKVGISGFDGNDLSISTGSGAVDRFRMDPDGNSWQGNVSNVTPRINLHNTGQSASFNGPISSGYAVGPGGNRRAPITQNWFTYSAGTSIGSNRYVHMKTNLWAGGSPNGNVEFTMSVFTYHSYYYYGSNYYGYGTIGWHNWSGSYYNIQKHNYGNFNLVQSSYTSSDGYVVLVADVIGGYAQFSIDWAQWGGYDFRDKGVTNVTNTTSATGAY